MFRVVLYLVNLLELGLLLERRRPGKVCPVVAVPSVSGSVALAAESDIEGMAVGQVVWLIFLL